jgi:hypothetical protein
MGFTAKSLPTSGTDLNISWLKKIHRVKGKHFRLHAIFILLWEDIYVKPRVQRSIFDKAFSKSEGGGGFDYNYSFFYIFL